ncbi:MAG TPA: hypothetical protein VIV08_00690 [Acidimicrobiia bacterium]
MDDTDDRTDLPPAETHQPHADFAHGERTTPDDGTEPDFARGERTLPEDGTEPDFARGQREDDASSDDDSSDDDSSDDSPDSPDSPEVENELRR